MFDIAFLVCRYIVTDSEKPHFRVVWLSGGLTRADLERAKVAHRQVANDNKKFKTGLDPTTWMDRMLTFEDRSTFPLVRGPRC